MLSTLSVVNAFLPVISVIDYSSDYSSCLFLVKVFYIVGNRTS